MSFFNMAAGNNPMFGILARIIETVAPLPTIPRYRDMYTMDHDGKLVIVVYTRTGGSGYGSDNAPLMAHPLFREKFDDKFDHTFANFVYEVPEKFIEPLRAFHDEFSRFYKGKTPQERFRITMAGLRNEPVPEEPDDQFQLQMCIVAVVQDLPTELSSVEKQLLPDATITALVDRDTGERHDVEG